MGYQLPGLGNVTFPGFGALGKQQTKDSRHPKKGKSSASQSSSSSSSAVPASTASSAAKLSCEESRLLDRGFLQKWRVELRPLLKSLRFVEESNRESCGGDVGSRIGPFRISRHYHQDAWRHSPPLAWSRCRDLNHAESTVIAYWFKHCPEAVEKRDFKTLAKIHKGPPLSSTSSWSQCKSFSLDYAVSPPELRPCGPDGLQKEETNCFWIKVSQHLKEQEAVASKKENTAWVFFSNENRKQENPGKMRQKSSPVLSPINNNTMASSKADSSYGRSPANSVTPPKQQLPLIQTLKPRLFRRAAAPAKEKSSVSSLLVGAVKHDSRPSFEDLDCRSTNKRLRQMSFFHSNTKFDLGSLGHAFNMDFTCLSRKDQMERGAICVQAIWRMRCVRRKYVQMRSAALLIQRKWRKQHVSLVCKKSNCLRSDQDLNRMTSLSLNTLSTLIDGEKKGVNARPIGSPCELLYRGDISPNQEDELLSELVSLLNLDTQSLIDTCPSFRFPPLSEEAGEACTPKMTLEMRQNFAESPTLFTNRKAEEPNCITLSCSKNTPLVIKQALLSPFMEKEIISELAKLFPPCKAKTCKDVSTESLSIAGPKDGSTASSRSMENESNVVQELCEKDSIIRRLTFNSAGSKGTCGSAEIAALMDLDCLEEHANAQCSILSTAGGVCPGTSSSSFGIKADRDEEELKHIGIPLLVAQSPVLASRKRVRSRNPCNRKTEKALVSSLNEWQYADSFDKESEGQEALREEGLKADVSTDSLSLFTFKEINTSKDFVLCALTKSMTVTCTNPSPKSRLMDISTDADDPTHMQVSDDCLLETSYEETSTVYAKAIFRCLNFSMDVYDDRESISEVSQTRSRKTGCGGIPALSSSRRASLQSLCKLWDACNVDLLTRSLKFKALQAMSCKNQQEHSAAGDIADIELEIANLENLPEDRKRKELVVHQRDAIYTKVAVYCDAQERQNLYNKWEIQKLLTGRLKKIVYELLWVEPQRYEESAELVIRYL